MRAGRAPSAGASATLEVGCATLPAYRCVHPSARSLKPLPLGTRDFTEASSCRLNYDLRIQPFSPPESPKLPSMAGLTGDQPASRAHPEPLREQEMLLVLSSLRDSQGF